MTDTPKHGGPRPGAGRKKGSGRFGEDTPQVQIRIPVVDKPAVIAFVERRVAARQLAALSPQELATRHPGVVFLPERQAREANTPLYATRVRAGMPAPADDHREDTIDLNRLLIADEGASFMVRVEGDSMINAGIAEGDLLVVDRKRNARHGDIVLASVDGEFTVKRLFRRPGRVALIPENDRYPAIELADGSELQLWGVVTGCIKRF